MPISFACPHCGHRTLVADQYLGQSGPCAGCGKIVTVPGPGTPGMPFGQPGPSGQPGQPGRGGGGAMVAVVVIVVVVLVMLVACGGMFAWVGFQRSSIQSARMAASAASSRSQCSNNLKQIALALHNYHDVYKCFPPAVFADKSGKPMHSWRVALLPFLEQQPLYQQYRWNEPWDSPHNRALANRFFDVYSCPDDGSPPNHTSYVMITGPNTLGGKPNEGAKLFEITDGTSNTIAVVEVSNSGIGWMEPRDLPIESMAMEVDGPPGRSISSNHPGGAYVALADGSVVLLPSGTDAETLRRLLIRNDGKPVQVPR